MAQLFHFLNKAEILKISKLKANNTSLSLAFLAKYIRLASLFPSKCGQEKPNLP